MWLPWFKQGTGPQSEVVQPVQGVQLQDSTTNYLQAFYIVLQHANSEYEILIIFEV